MIAWFYMSYVGGLWISHVNLGFYIIPKFNFILKNGHLTHLIHIYWTFHGQGVSSCPACRVTQVPHGWLLLLPAEAEHSEIQVGSSESSWNESCGSIYSLRQKQNMTCDNWMAWDRITVGEGSLRSAGKGHCTSFLQTAGHPRWLSEVAAELHMWERQPHYVSKTRMPIFCFTRKHCPHW